MTKSEATKARIALISRLLQWALGTLIVVASGTIGYLSASRKHLTCEHLIFHFTGDGR